MIDAELITRKMVLISKDLAALEPLASKERACAGLRNRIVHEYDELDPAKVHDALQFALREIPEYLRRVEAFLSAGRSAP